MGDTAEDEAATRLRALAAERGPGLRDTLAERFCQISRHFQTMTPDIEAINGQSHNLSCCRGILARKLTEPVPRAYVGLTGLLPLAIAS